VCVCVCITMGLDQDLVIARKAVQFSSPKPMSLRLRWHLVDWDGHGKLLSVFEVLEGCGAAVLFPCLLFLYLDLVSFGFLEVQGKHGLNSMTCPFRQCFSALSISPWISTNPSHCQITGSVDSHPCCWLLSGGDTFCPSDLMVNFVHDVSRHCLEWNAD
jgi:hypothetical protein